MRRQAVQGADVILHRLLDLTRSTTGEPTQRHPGQPTGDGLAQVAGDVIVGQVGDHLPQRNQGHAEEQAGQTDTHHLPDWALQLDPTGCFTHGQLRNVGDASQGHHGQHGPKSGQYRGEYQPPTNRA